MDNNLIKKLMSISDKKHFEAWELGLENKDLKPLVRLGIVKIVYKSNKNTEYQIDKEKFKEYLELIDTPIELKGEMFSHIIGYDEHKEIIKKAIENNVSLILLGQPATAKTYFLLELRKLPKSVYITSDISLAGLRTLIDVTEPRVLLIDQIENIKDKFVYNFLLDLLEHGISTNIKSNVQKHKEYNTMVIATANSIKRIPEALLSRFLIIKFEKYSREEFEKIVRTLLKDVNPEVLNEIINVLDKYNHYDIRTAIKLSKICKSKEDVEKYSKLIVLL